MIVQENVASPSRGVAFSPNPLKNCYWQSPKPVDDVSSNQQLHQVGDFGAGDGRMLLLWRWKMTSPPWSCFVLFSLC